MNKYSSFVLAYPGFEYETNTKQMKNNVTIIMNIIKLPVF